MRGAAVALGVLLLLGMTVHASSADQPSPYRPVPQSSIRRIVWPVSEGMQQPAASVALTSALAAEVPVAASPRPPLARTRRPVVAGGDTHVGTAAPRDAATAGTPASPAPSGSGSVTTPDSTIHGIASWYATGGPGVYAAAGPPLRRGNWRGEIVTVCAGRCIALRITDWCQCFGTRVLDLSLGAVSALGLDRSRGLFEVEVWLP